ncbi:DUF192 domain-containing protein [Paracandidimonas soli]|uniref:DUF192 domain-containing protein n=1 Tax=Paracandidimonas soli TaxID=1917182 RepID=UPI00333F7B51
MRLRLLSSFRQRLLGLHACAEPAEHEGVWLVPCAAIHTFLLPYAVDVLFLDSAYRVMGRRHELPPNRMAWHWGAASVVELPGGYCRRHPDHAFRVREAAVAMRPITDRRCRPGDSWRRRR